jgi:hypothetical protein
MRNGELNKLVGVASRILLAFLFAFSQSTWARQDQNAKDKADLAQTASARQDQAKQTTAASAKTQTEAQGENAQNTVAEQKRSGDGSHEGITIHGHWTIEVHNPDGSLVRHVEFENSLDAGFSTPNPTAGQPPIVVPGGAAYLSAVLSGQWSAPVVPDFWGIILVGPSGLSNLTNLSTTTNAPCVGPQLAACIIEPVTVSACGSPVASLSCNLSVTALGTSPAFTGIRLTGSVSATQIGQISTVATLIGNLTCLASVPNCLPTSVVTASFTSSTNFPGAPIAVVAGQTIAVTVVISFS